MRDFLHLLAVILPIIGARGQSVSLIDLDNCIGPVTTAPNCDFYVTNLVRCRTLTEPSAASSCYCPQPVLNALAGCQGEIRECIAGDMFDAQFEGPGGLYADWHSACDGVLDYVPTTPSIFQPDITVDGDVCQSYGLDCQRWGSLTEACTRSYTRTADISSCWCQSRVLEAASRCEIDFPSSCQLSTIISSDLWEFQICGAGAASVASGQTTAPGAADQSTSVAGGLSTPASTSPPMSIPSIPPIAGPTSTSTSSGASSTGMRMGSMVALMIGVGLVLCSNL